MIKTQILGEKQKNANKVRKSIEKHFFINLPH